MTYISKPWASLITRLETAFGAMPDLSSVVGHKLQPNDFALPQLAQEFVELNEGAKPDMLPAATLPGRKGGAGPQIKTRLAMASGSRYDDTVSDRFVPDDYLQDLWRASLGTGAAIYEGATGHTYAPRGWGIVTGGTKIASKTGDGGAPEYLASFTTQAADSGYFTRGAMCIIVAAATGVPYVCQVSDVDTGTDTITVVKSPLLASVSVNDKVYGTWCLHGPVPGVAAGADTANLNESLSFLLTGIEGARYAVSGVQGSGSVELAPGAPTFQTFDFQHQTWLADPTTGVVPAPVTPTAFPSARPYILAANAYVRIEDANGGLTTTTQCASVKFDWGLTRADMPDVNAGEGLAGRQIVAPLAPRLTLKLMQVPAHWQTTQSTAAVKISVIVGNATSGYWGVYMRAAKLEALPSVSDESGLIGAEVIYRATADDDNLNPCAMFFA